MDKARKFIRNVLSGNDALQGLLGPDTDDVGEVLLPIILSNPAKKMKLLLLYCTLGKIIIPLRR